MDLAQSTLLWDSEQENKGDLASFRGKIGREKKITSEWLLMAQSQP
jgi:hypothetical protein